MYFAAATLVEQTQFNLGRVFREKCKVDALAVPIRAEGIRPPWPDDQAISILQWTYLSKKLRMLEGWRS
jgi:hypothetical protein